jgi:hypothetical protein
MLSMQSARSAPCSGCIREHWRSLAFLSPDGRRGQVLRSCSVFAIRLVPILVTLGCLAASAQAQPARLPCPVTAKQVTAAAKKPMKRILSEHGSGHAVCTFADARASEPFRLTIFSSSLHALATYKQIAAEQIAADPGAGVHVFQTARNGIAEYPVDTNWGPRTGLNFQFLGASGHAWQFTLVVSSAFHPTQASAVGVVMRLRNTQTW